MGIVIYGILMGMLGILMDGKEDTFGIPQIEGPIETRLDCVVTMMLNDGKVDITGVPPVLIMDSINGSTTLDKTIGLKMVLR
jgi:hypothetical protein